MNYKIYIIIFIFLILIKLENLKEKYSDYKKINCNYSLLKIGKNYFVNKKRTKQLIKVKHKTMNKILFKNPECDLGELRILKKKNDNFDNNKECFKKDGLIKYHNNKCIHYKNNCKLIQNTLSECLENNLKDLTFY